MKPIDYPDNGRGLFVQYHRMREGPNYFLVCYKNSSVLRQDPKDAWRVMGSAKFTSKSQELKQWCLDIHQEYNKTEKEGRVDTSFGSGDLSSPNEVNKEEETETSSESLDENSEDPTSNTKMIV